MEPFLLRVWKLALMNLHLLEVETNVVLCVPVIPKIYFYKSITKNHNKWLAIWH